MPEPLQHAGQPWTREEMILALDLYFRIPFGQIHKTNPDIIKLADFIGRSPSSVGMRLGNYAACDPAIIAAGLHGLDGGGDACREYWNEFSAHRGKLRDAAIECRARIIEIDDNLGIVPSHVSEWDSFVDELYNIRFQNIVKKNYQDRCAISGLNLPQCLVGCHIIPLDVDKDLAYKANNGICLNILYARPYMEGLIGIDPDYRIHFSSKLQAHCLDSGYHLYKRYEGKQLLLNSVIVKPDPHLLERHMDTIFLK